MALGANPMCHFLAQFFSKLDDHPRLQSPWLTSSISGTRVMAQKPRCAQNPKTAEKARVSHWRLARPAITRQTLMLQSYSILVKSCSLHSKKAFWFFFYDVIARTLSWNCDSNFGWILCCGMNLWSPRSTSWRFWCQSYGQKTGNFLVIP